MTGKTFLRAVSNGETDILETFLSILKEIGTSSKPIRPSKPN